MTANGPLLRVYREAAALLRDLDAVERSASDLSIARRYITVMIQHLGPLRNAVEETQIAAGEEAA